jgi:lipopolysaccharide/colanic/teichoic acid biosynthesis glycosyltransferase
MDTKFSCDTFAVLMNTYLQGFSKRALDLVLSLLLLPVAAVLILVGVLLVGFTSRGPIFFTQERIGRGGQAFQIYKIRTLQVGENGDLAGMKKGDPSILLVGRWLRRWRIDELPQLVNIIAGDMSWVGPRPERPHLVAKFSEMDVTYMNRHQALPGITGWAQVHYPDATPNENLKKLPLDLEYIERASLAMDVRILWKTILAIG